MNDLAMIGPATTLSCGDGRFILIFYDLIIHNSFQRGEAFFSMNTPTVLLETPQLASWCDWTGIDPLPLSAGDRSCLLWLRSGTGEAHTERSRIPVSEGTCLFVPPNAEVTIRPPEGIPLRIVLFYMTGLQIQGIAKGFLAPHEHPFVIPVIADAARIFRILEDVHHEARHPRLGSREIISSLLQALLIHFLREIDLSNAGQPDSGAAQPDAAEGAAAESSATLAQIVRGYIERNFQLELSLSDLAQFVFVSPYHLAHVFKEEIGMSPIQYLIKCRIDEAKRLLLNTEAPVREIALKVGYPNANYFNLLFSKMTGKSPGKFRKSK